VSSTFESWPHNFSARANAGDIAGRFAEATGFVAADFVAGFFAGAFFATVFAAGFFAAGFLVADFTAAAFLAAGFLAADVAVGFLAAGLRGAMAELPSEVFAQYGAKMPFFQAFFEARLR
jgi:hypothetical protein